MGNKNDKPVLLHLDSLGTHDGPEFIDNIKRFMQEELNSEVKNTIRCEVPQQPNTFDCGLYVLLFIEKFINQAPERMETEYRMMFGKKWFEEKEATDLRGKMINILDAILQEGDIDLSAVQTPKKKTLINDDESKNKTPINEQNKEQKRDDGEQNQKNKKRKRVGLLLGAVVDGPRIRKTVDKFTPPDFRKKKT